MKSKNFNHSLLAVGVAAVMGLSTGAIAGEQSTAGSALSYAEETVEINLVN